MSQHTEDQETLRRYARAELLVNLPAVEREMSEAMLVPLSGSIETTKQFIAAVREYLHGEEELEREQQEETTVPEFKPSEVRMWRGILPLIDTFGHAETEFAAALMVIACADNGDEWQPLIPSQLGMAMQKAGQAGGCLEHLKSNPFMPRPDLRRLAADGFAVFLGNPDDAPAPPIQFTEKGFDVLRRAVASADGLADGR